MNCHVCNEPIVNSAEQIDRIYEFIRHPRPQLNGRRLGPRKHHDACDAKFAAEKTHLKKVENS